VLGTRPEAIKMAPVLIELAREANCQSIVCSTGQHREMLDQVFRLFDLHPDFDLQLMSHNQTLASLTARLCDGLEPIVKEVKPNWIVAQGDTTTVMVSALIAFYHHIPFAHVEAGLRTNNLRHPFPEELNRRISDEIAALLFAPTEMSRQTLLDEGVAGERIIVTGNTVIDALHRVSRMPYDWSNSPLHAIPLDRTLVLVTAHRRESFGEPFEQICLAIRDLTERFREQGVHVVYPVHLNPNVRAAVMPILGGISNVSLIEPLDYLSLVQLMRKAKLILTDSGGIQEEAPGLNIPVLVMRETTERPEGVNAGVAKLVGTSRSLIVEEATRLLTDDDAWRRMAQGANPYGDGKAAARIVQALRSRA
jgi:UDP-N-acetylglucosamine 2-epimerase